MLVLQAQTTQHIWINNKSCDPPTARIEQICFSAVTLAHLKSLPMSQLFHAHERYVPTADGRGIIPDLTMEDRELITGIYFQRVEDPEIIPVNMLL